MKNLVLMVCVICLSLACKNKKTDPEAKKTDIEYLSGTTGNKKWILTDGFVEEGTLKINIIANQPPCITDNILTISSDKTYQIVEGATKCGAANPDLVIKAKWDYEESAKIFTIEKDQILQYFIDNAKFTMLSIDDKQFNARGLFTINGRNFTANVTFTAVP
jgi:hypothetical protein